MGKHLLTAAVLLAALSAVSLSEGAPIVVQGTLQALGTNDIEIDYWGFSVHTPGTVTIDTLSWEVDGSGNPVDVNGDGEYAFIDTHLLLFVDDGVLDFADLIGENNDSSSTYGDGSIDARDGYLAAPLNVGDYLLAISAYHMSPTEAIVLHYNLSRSPFDETLQRNDHGDYQITFDGPVYNVHIPEPTTIFLLGMGAVSLAILRQRRKK